MKCLSCVLPLQDKALQPAIEEQKRLMKQYGNELSYDVMQVSAARHDSGKGLWLTEQQEQQQQQFVAHPCSARCSTAVKGSYATEQQMVKAPWHTHMGYTLGCRLLEPAYA